jgi:hypothetical protein
MIDAEVNAEEPAESRKQREATANAADYDMPVTSASESRAAEGIQHSIQRAKAMDPVRKNGCTLQAASGGRERADD